MGTADVHSIVLHLKHTVLSLWQDPAVRLAIPRASCKPLHRTQTDKRQCSHGLRTQRGRWQEYFDIFALNGLGHLGWIRLQQLHQNQGVLLRPNSLSSSSVVICTRLIVNGGEDRVAMSPPWKMSHTTRSSNTTVLSYRAPNANFFSLINVLKCHRMNES